MIETEDSPQELKIKVTEWTKKMKKCIKLVAEPGPDREPYKNIYNALEISRPVRSEIEGQLTKIQSPKEQFLLKFALVHVISCQAKWYEASDELTDADKEHERCISIIENVLREAQESGFNTLIDSQDEIINALRRFNFMLIYEFTRYAILCSERDNPEKALELLKKAEESYHIQNNDEILPSTIKSNTILGLLDSLNSETIDSMFIFVLFYLGQAYKIEGEKEKACLYLHKVLRRQYERGDYNPIIWASDTVKMASVISVNMQNFESSRTFLLAAQTVLGQTPIDEQGREEYRQAYADLGRSWAKLGVDLLQVSSDRLRDLEDQARKPHQYKNKLLLSKYEKLSLDINANEEEFDTIILVNALNFPTIDVSSAVANEMPCFYVRDFNDARKVFLPLQRWTNIAKEFYVLNEYASDYIDIQNTYSLGFKYLAFFENNLEREIKMNRKRVRILTDLVSSLNPKIYQDAFHYSLRDLSEIYENIYKLKVSDLKQRGLSLRPKDKKLVRKLIEAVDAHKKNLEIFEFDILNPKKDFIPDYEKSLLGSVLSIGRILGGITHDHPLHEDAIFFAEEGKKYYKYFLQYLDFRPLLKEDFRILYDGSSDLPELLDKQIEKIKHRLETLRTY